MKIISALDYEDIEDYLRYLDGVNALDIVRDKRSLLDTADSGGYDLALLSGKFFGSDNARSLIELLSSERYKGLRIAFIYGKYDSSCDDFIKFLISCNIFDFHVGEEITSQDIERLMFKPSCRAEALSYHKGPLSCSKYYHRREKTPQNLLRNWGFGIRTNRNNDSIPPGKLIISIISNQATGKSHTAWNLGCCFSKQGIATSIFNIDRGYSANLYYDIDPIYYDLLEFTINNNKQRDILKNCCKRKNLNIITGKLGCENEISGDDFTGLLYCIRTKSDATIIDTRTGLSELTRLSVRNSAFDLIIFDCDVMHFHMNMKMLEGLGDDFAPEKAIAVINNTDIRSPAHKFIYNELTGSGIPFRDIVFIRNCGFAGYESMHTDHTPYQAAESDCKDFIRDMDGLSDRLCGGLGRRCKSSIYKR